MSRYIVSPHAQRTPGWHQDRLGKLTGSQVGAIFGKDGRARATLRRKLVLERMLGKPLEDDPYESPAMAWGNEQESSSRMAAEGAIELDIEQAGFVYLSRIAAGCSTDGMIYAAGALGIWESKSPKTQTHYTYILGGVLPHEYRPQVTHNMWVTGAQFAIFTSYDPRMPGNLKLFLVRVERNQAEIDAHERAVLQFLAEVDQEEKRMRLMADEPVIIR